MAEVDTSLAQVDELLQQRQKYEPFAGVVRDERDLVNGSRLTDAVHPSAALMQAQWRPGELEMQDQPARMVEVEALGRRVGRDQKGVACRERRDQREARLMWQPTVQQIHAVPRLAERPLKMLCGVPVLGEDDGRLANPPQETEDDAGLALGGCCGFSGLGQNRQHPPLVLRVQDFSGKARIGHEIVRLACIPVFPRKRLL